MAVVICLPLFGPPGREMEEGVLVRGPQLRDLGKALCERLNAAADTLDRLNAAGWSARVAIYDLMLSLPGVETKDDAVRRLQALGVSLDDLIVVEEIDDDEDTAPGD